MSTSLGYIALHRKIEDSFVYQDSELLHLWIHCLIKANYIDRTIMFDGSEVSLKRGQFITGRKSLAKALKTTEQKIRSRLALLQSHHKIVLKSTNKYSIITVLKYDYYQADRNNLTSKQPTDNQQITTDNKVNKDNKDISDKSQKDMGWKQHNENAHSDDIPSIGDDGEIEKTEEKKLKEQNEKVTALIEWAEKVRKKKFVDTPTQRKHIHDMRKAHISPVQIKETYLELLHSEYWQKQERLPDFKTVFSNLKNKK